MNLLLVVSHPDDECFCLGTLTRLAENGARVTAMFVTSGEGDRRVDDFLRGDETRQDARERETRAAAQHWPVHELLFERLPDDKDDDQQHITGSLHARLVEYLRDRPCDVIITHGSDGEYGHPCHVAVNRVVTRLVGRRTDDVGLLTFNAIDLGNRLVKQINLSDPAALAVDVSEYWRSRRAVFDCYESQRERFRPYLVRDDVDADLEAYITLRNTETFRVVHAPRNTHVLRHLFGPALLGAPRVLANRLLSRLASLSDLPVRAVARLNRRLSAGGVGR